MNDETQSPEVNPEDVQTTRGQNLAREAARWRVQYRTAQSEIETLKQKLAAFEGGGNGNASADAPASASPGATVPDSAEAAPLPMPDDEDTRALLAFREQLATTLMRQQLATAGVLPDAIEDAIDLLAGRGALTVGNDGVPALVIDGSPQPIDRASVRRLLSDRWHVSDGHPGSGARGGNRAAVSGSNFDLSNPDTARKYRTDPSFRARFRQHMGITRKS